MSAGGGTPPSAPCSQAPQEVFRPSPSSAPRPLPAPEGKPQTSSGGAWSRSHGGSRSTGGKPAAWPTQAGTEFHPRPALPGLGAPRAGAAAATKEATARLRSSAAGSGAVCFRAPSLLGASAGRPREGAGGTRPKKSPARLQRPPTAPPRAAGPLRPPGTPSPLLPRVLALQEGPGRGRSCGVGVTWVSASRDSHPAGPRWSPGTGSSQAAACVRSESAVLSGRVARASHQMTQMWAARIPRPPGGPLSKRDG